LADYDIKTFPMFALINTEGEIVQYPAYKPSEFIDQYFDELLKRKQ